MHRIARTLLAGLLLGALAPPLAAYTVVLVDGSEVVAREPPRFEGDRAILTMPNGTETFLRADEIDPVATRVANEGRGGYGTAQVLEGGEVRSMSDAPQVQTPDTLADLIARGKASTGKIGAPARRRPSDKSDRPEISEEPAAEPAPYADAEMAEALREAFVSAGATDARALEGNGPSAPRIEAIADTEAAVFRLLRVAAVLVEAQEQLDGMELYLVTSQGARAGHFLLDAEQARGLAAGEIEPARFFVEHVVF